MTHSHAVEFCEVTKQFGKVVANDKISFSVKKGSICALIGENGAGKSTAMKILFGLYKEDSGEILVNGKPQHWRSPRDAIKNKIGMVHQHFMLAETETALDNIILGEEARNLKFPLLPTFLNVIDRKKAKKEIEELAQKYGLSLPLEAKVSTLSVGMHQRIEILKILYRHADILILDEPTAVLSPLEVDTLFENLKKLKDEGKTIIIVTHKLREVLNFTDELIVFKGGHVVGKMPTSEATEEKIATMMIGRKVNLNAPLPAAKIIGEPIVQLEQPKLSIHSGEIVGIAGVEGNGQSELLAFLHKYVHKKKNLIAGFIPEDRHHNGLLLNMSVYENYLLGRQREKKFLKFSFAQNKKEVFNATQAAMKKYDVRPNNIDLSLSSFSGGNQQKIIIAREFDKKPNFIIAAHPTRGVDIGAIEFIHKQIVEERDKGAGVLLISSELDEIMRLSDRILVMFRNKIVAEFKRTQSHDWSIDEHVLGLAMGGSLAEQGAHL